MRKIIAVIIAAVVIMCSCIGCGNEGSYIEDSSVLSQFCGDIVSGDFIKEMAISYPTEDEFKEVRYAVKDFFSQIELTTDLGQEYLDACQELLEQQIGYYEYYWDERQDVGFTEDMEEALQENYEECEEISQEFGEKIEKEYEELNEELYE